MTKMSLKVVKNFDPEEALYKVLSQSVEDVSRVLTSKARNEAPVDTGFLKASIKHNIEKLRAMITAWAHYAPYVEYGTMYQRSNPFFRRAIEGTIRLVPTIIARNVRRYMK